MSRRVGAAIALLIAVVPDVSPALTPSPEDWRDVVMYQVITDRFFDGNAANNNASGTHNPSSGFGSHGGDWAGLTLKLDYMQSMGVGAVWISPVVKGRGEYHGYAAQDFNSVAPQFGTMANLRAFVDAAHARGMYVIIDVVTNHTGNFIDSTDPGWNAFRNPGTYNLRFRSSARQAAPFNNLSWYHNNGGIDNFVDPNQILGELSSLDDLRTELPEVRDALFLAYANLILATDCDGFRVDTVKHVEHGFWQDWCPRIRQFAVDNGKANFLLFGEALDSSDSKVGSYTGTRAGGAFEFDSMLYYPMFYTTNDVFVWGGATSQITSRYSQLVNYEASSRERMITFLDNHDQPRFLSRAVADGNAAKLRPALVFQMLSVGVPCLYYGTEQDFEGNRAGNQSNDPYDREDMFDGSFEFGTSLGDNFNQTHPTYLFVQRLADLKRTHALFRRGNQGTRAHSAGQGLYAFTRSLAPDTALVAFNTSASSLAPSSLATGLPEGTEMTDVLTGTVYGNVAAGGSIAVSLDGYESVVLMASSSVVPPTPAVVESTPSHGATGTDNGAEIRLRFNRPMDAASVQAAFSTSPPATFYFRAIDEHTFGFTPTTALASNILYRARVATTARERDAVGDAQRTMAGGFEVLFRTATPTAKDVWSVR